MQNKTIPSDVYVCASVCHNHTCISLDPPWPTITQREMTVDEQMQELHM